MKDKIINTMVIGATGYVGIELVRILASHPNLQLKYVVSESNNGQALSKIYPHLTNIVELQLMELNLSAMAPEIDVVFLALPHGKAAKLIKDFIQLGKKVIDLSADLRINDREVYYNWYGVAAPDTELLNQAVYGLADVAKQFNLIRETNLVANPGCYSTASILAIAPALDSKIVSFERIIIDAKSGVSGSGRGAKLANHYCEVNESFAAYSIGGTHRHTPEIEQELSKIAGAPISIQFTPHLVPMLRGLMATVYLELKSQVTLEKVFEVYANYYKNQPFVRIRCGSDGIATKPVRGSNYCDISLYHDKRTNNLIVISVIDNLIKGAAGQAVQNLNIMYDLSTTTGLEHLAIYP